MECLHAYGIHSATLQPELLTPAAETSGAEIEALATGTDARGSNLDQVKQRKADRDGCQFVCSNQCETKRCC